MGKIISSLFNNALFYEKVFKNQVTHEIVTYEPNVKILTQGKKHSFFCFIKQGEARIVLNADLNNKAIHTVAAIVKADDVFGEFILFNNKAAGADVISNTKIEIVKVDVKTFKAFMDRDPQFGYQILTEFLEIIVNRLQTSNSAVLHLMGCAISCQNRLSEKQKSKEVR